MTLTQFIKELNGDRAEGEIIKTVFYSLITSIVFLAVLYFLKLKYIDSFASKYGLFLFLASLSYALIMPAVRQVRAYKEMPCMSGMMVGMTVGMIASFLPGFYVASTNGMFYGSVFGMAVGIGFGIYNGKCCGIMGMMEGVMAGFMGGLMGAMTSFMLLNDHLIYASIIVLVISAGIMFGLYYMIYKEMKEGNRVVNEDQFMNITLTLILMAVTTWLIVYGPRGGLLA